MANSIRTGERTPLPGDGEAGEAMNGVSYWHFCAVGATMVMSVLNGLEEIVMSCRNTCSILRFPSPWVTTCIALLSLVFCSAASGQDARRGDVDVDVMLSAIVNVRMKALPDARSNATLGAERQGSGVVIDDKGHILTIGYIVTEADAIEVTTQKGRTVPAVLQAYDHATGFALLQAGMPLEVTPVTLGDSAALALREPVMVLPAGGREAASIAYVVSKRTFTGGWEYLLDTAIFTSPPTMQWAGAALINHDGKLVGIGSLLVRDSVEPGTPLPGNMFVPIDTVKPILADLIEKGRRSGPVQPWLGMSTEEAQGRLFVTRVSPGGPAERAGVRRGDLVLGVGSTAVKSLEEFYRSMWALGAAGVDIPLKMLQGADLREVRVRSMDRLDYFREKPAL